MPRVEAMSSTWAFIASLVAVINGLGIVRLLGACAEFLRRRHSLGDGHYWVYYVLAVFQLLVHVLFWWSILGLHSVSSMNFLHYLYLLIGPTLLFLATSVLIPDVDTELADLRAAYQQIRKDYYTMMPVFWTWAIFIWPVFIGKFAPTVPLIVVFLSISLVLRFTDDLRVHGWLVVANCLLYAAFIARFALELGGVGRSMNQF